MTSSEAASFIVRTQPIFQLSDRLLTALQRHRDASAEDDICRRHDAFLLDPGLGPPTYLTSDGRVLWEDDTWNVPATRAYALVAIHAGISKTGITALRELLPNRPHDASDCAECHGTGRFDADGQMRDLKGQPFSFICMKCAGLGWHAPSVDLEEVLLDPLPSDV